MTKPLSGLKSALRSGLAVAAIAFLVTVPAVGATPARSPWMDTALSSDQRAGLLLNAMTEDEKLLMVFGYASGDQLTQIDPTVIPGINSKEIVAKVIPGSAGYVPGVKRLGIPAQFQTDASMGVRNPNLERTSLPSSLATAASWDPKVTEAGGRMIGSEARLSGFNVMLAGGVNLLREPRNGRNFEYTGEDPLLAGTMAAGLIRGIQANNIVSTVKHFSINSQETGRTIVSAQVSEPALRMSDNLAFEMAIEQSSPGSVMCSYNKINDIYACENDQLLNQTLKSDWGFKGYVMSDWGAVHSTVHAANSGLDQQSGFPFDKKPFFGVMLKDALDDGSVAQARLDDMVRRILWALFDKGVMDNPIDEAPAKAASIDFAADHQVAQAAAEQSLVLLKNDRDLLPLKTPKSVAVIGSYADKAVLAGGGSSGVTPVGGNAVPGLEPTSWPGPVIWQPSSPMKALQGLRPRTRFTYNSGDDIAAAVRAAAAADVAIVFVHQWAGEAFDVSLSLTGHQDDLVAAVAKANPNVIVVVESGGPVLMPWAKDVKSILAAFYPGARGGEAIARVLTGEVNPSGHLPITFPASDEQLVRAKLDGEGLPEGTPFTARCSEGAAIGYKWYDAKSFKPLYAFGHGLSYTTFLYSDLTVQGGPGDLSVSFTITNTGKREGKAVGQVYVSGPDSAGWEAPKRLAAFDKLTLAAGASGRATVKIDPRLLAVYDEATHEWVIAPGRYSFRLGGASDELGTEAALTVPGLRFSARHGK